MQDLYHQPNYLCYQGTRRISLQHKAEDNDNDRQDRYSVHAQSTEVSTALKLRVLHL